MVGIVESTLFITFASHIFSAESTFFGQAGGVHLHAWSVLSRLICLFSSLCVVQNNLTSWKHLFLLLDAFL